MTILLVSCDKEEEPNSKDNLTILGTWNENFIKRYSTNGDLTAEESLDTIRLIMLSIDDFTIQEMLIDTAHSFFFLMYSSYVFENGVLKTYPDSLIDIDMNKYYWNSLDSTLGSFPIQVKPFESKIEQSDNSEFVENRVIEGSGSLDLFFNRTNEVSIDLKNEFENYRGNLKTYKASINNRFLNEESKSEKLEVMPVYNN